MTTTHEEYEKRESKAFHQQMANTKADPYRKEGGEAFTRALTEYPEVVAERAEWAIDGNYGYGAMQYLRGLCGTQNSKRVCLFYTIAGLEWRTSPYYAGKAWKTLNKKQQTHINGLFDTILNTPRYALERVAGEVE
mgnify:CR=1 FL=1|tara:strand:- start:5684 stop:6091 length:408 start_codon:yes stop_codon:yes gene_type:complete